MSSFEQWAETLGNLQPEAERKKAFTSWDFVQLGGVTVPGVARVTASVPDGLDVQKPKGGKRASIVDNGDPPIKFRIEIEILPDALAEFADEVVPILRKRDKTGGRPPLGVVHPEFQIWGVDTVAITTIDSPPPQSGGTKTITINCVEWADKPAKIKADTTPRKPTTTFSPELGIQDVNAIPYPDPDDQFGLPGLQEI